MRRRISTTWFTRIRRSTDTVGLAATAQATKAAEAMAPARPNAGVESGAKNMVLGPVAALMDRAKDSIRETRGNHG